MRLAVFSDTHANYEALSAVLEAYRRERIDVYYCLGDTVGYGGSPNECADLVRKLSRSTILGNHDAAVAGRMDYSYYYEAARHALDAHASILSPENAAWLRSLPYREDLVDHGVTLCHGSPVRLEEFEYIFAPEQARECLPMFRELQHLTLIGHSHLCKVFALTPTTVEELPPIDFVLEPGKKYIVSVGSVGQPRDYDNRASYTVYDTDAKRFEFKPDRVRHRDRRREGPARQARAQLRPSPLYRRLSLDGAASGPKPRRASSAPGARPPPVVRRSRWLHEAAVRWGRKWLQPRCACSAPGALRAPRGSVRRSDGCTKRGAVWVAALSAYAEVAPRPARA